MAIFRAICYDEWMQSEPELSIAEALRDAVAFQGRPRRTTVQEVLRESVDDCLVRIGALAPRDDLMSEGLARLGDVEGIEAYSDEDLLARWTEIVSVLALGFISAPSAWEGTALPAFFDACSSCFGVDLDRIPTLLVKFHELPIGDRIALFELLGQSKSLGCFGRALERCANSDTSANPMLALRALIQATFREE